MTFDIRPITVSEVRNDVNFPEIERRYTEESAQPGFDKGEVNWRVYEALEGMGNFKMAGGFVDDSLVGFTGVIFSRALHKSVPTATIDAIYILPEYRKGGLGGRLLKAAGKIAKEEGAEQLLVSTPPNSKIERLCDALKFRRLNTIYAYSLC